MLMHSRLIQFEYRRLLEREKNALHENSKFCIIDRRTQMCVFKKQQSRGSSCRFIYFFFIIIIKRALLFPLQQQQQQQKYKVSQSQHIHTHFSIKNIEWVHISHQNFQWNSLGILFWYIVCGNGLMRWKTQTVGKRKPFSLVIHRPLIFFLFKCLLPFGDPLLQPPLLTVLILFGQKYPKKRLEE